MTLLGLTLSKTSHELMPSRFTDPVPLNGVSPTMW